MQKIASTLQYVEVQININAKINKQLYSLTENNVVLWPIGDYM